MTENEIINIDDCLEELKSHRDTYLKRSTPWRIVNRAVRVILSYRAIGTVEECCVAVERVKPKKVFQPFGTHSYKCSNCWQFVAHEVDDDCDLSEMAEWCPYCGQHLDWSE